MGLEAAASRIVKSTVVFLPVEALRASLQLLACRVVFKGIALSGMGQAVEDMHCLSCTEVYLGMGNLPSNTDCQLCEIQYHVDWSSSLEKGAAWMITSETLCSVA